MTKVTLALVAALAISHPVLCQTSPDMQKILDRLDTLEAENQKLLDEIRALRTELIERNSERLDVQESRTAELDQAKVGASQKLPVTFTGMLLFNAFQNGRNSGTAEYPTAAALNAAPRFTGASLRQTVLGLKFNGPDLPGGGKASGQIYMDFFAGTSSPFNNLLHIRTATLDLTWKDTTVTFGQDKPLISPREPSSMAQVGISPLTGAGNLWDWQPQIRIEQRLPFAENTGLLAQGAIYQTNESYPSTLPGDYVATLERARPGYEGRIEFYHGTDTRRFEIAPGFHLSTTHVGGVSVPSQIASLDWLVRPLSMVEFTGEFFHGQNVAPLGARQGFDILPADVIVPVHSQGEWAQISVFPVQRLSLHIYAGEQHDRSADVAPGGITRNFVYAGNLMYKLAPNVVAAFEASQARTQYLGSLLRLNNHYDLALGYLF